MAKYTVGIDFGTESARAVLVDVTRGAVVSTATYPYAHGVIDRTLPGRSDRLPPDWALQHPQDWLDAAASLMGEIARRTPADDIIGYWSRRRLERAG